MMYQTADFELEVSAGLKRSYPNREPYEWLSEMKETNILLGAAFRVMHPELYHYSREALLRLPRSPEQEEALVPWGTAFSALSVIVNRQTPAHRDTQSRSAWYDLLTTAGPYVQATLGFPGLGVSFPYPPGSLACFSGKLLQHEVLDCDGERVCVAYYLRDNVHERLGVRAADWMRVEHLGKCGQWFLASA